MLSSLSLHCLLALLATSAYLSTAINAQAQNGFNSNAWSATDNETYVAGVDSNSEVPVNETLGEEELNKELRDLYNSMELLKDLEAKAGEDREARTLLKKVSFLAGLKLGSVLQSSGTLAASNSFRIFGKVINSALSISYGNVGDNVVRIPQVVDVNAASNVIPGLARERVDRSKSTSTPESIDLPPYDANIPPPGPAIRTTPNPISALRTHFIQQHNQNVQRANQKFFKTAFLPPAGNYR